MACMLRSELGALLGKPHLIPGLHCTRQSHTIQAPQCNYLRALCGEACNAGFENMQVVTLHTSWSCTNYTELGLQ